MNWWIEIAKYFVGPSLGLGLFVLLAGYLVKSAIARAVLHAANLELESRKHELAKDMKQFESELMQKLEDGRKMASRDLELFKAELTLNAEVRRQVAQQKVSALLTFLRATQSFSKAAFRTQQLDGPGRAGLIFLLQERYADVEELRPLVSNAVFVKLSDYIAHVYNAGDRWRRGDDGGSWMKILDETREVIALVRSELGVAE